MAKQESSRQPTANDERHLLGEHTGHHGVTESTRREESGATVELREEELTARKQSVEAGEVRVGTEVTSQQRTVDVPVTHEEVTIERHAVNRRPADGSIGDQSKTIAIPVSEEQVSVEKRAVVYEEIEVGKRAVQQTQQVSGTVRKELVDVDAEGDVGRRDQNTSQR